MRKREHPPAPTPSFGDLAEDFGLGDGGVQASSFGGDAFLSFLLSRSARGLGAALGAFSMRVRLAVSSLSGVAVELVGPSGHATRGWFEPDPDYEPPFHAIGCRAVEAGPHSLRIFRSETDELGRMNFDVPDAPHVACKWARLSPVRQRALLDWLDGCGATCVVDRTCKIVLPLASYDAPEAENGASPLETTPCGVRLRDFLSTAQGKVVVVPNFADPDESKALVAKFRQAGMMGPAGEENATAGPKKRTNWSGKLSRKDAPVLVNRALRLFPDCDARHVELQIVK